MYPAISNNTMTADVKQGIVTSPDMIGPVTITSNTVDGAALYGFLLRSLFPQTVTENTVTRSGTGIYISPTSSAPDIRLNNIYRNAVGLDNESAYTALAANNWWGSISGQNSPGGDTITRASPVVYRPWIQQSYPPRVRGVSIW